MKPIQLADKDWHIIKESLNSTLEDYASFMTHEEFQRHTELYEFVVIKLEETK